MAYNELSCGSNQNNTGTKQCTEGFQDIQKIVLVPLTQEFASQTAAETLANWTTLRHAAAGTRGYPFPLILEKEDISEATLYKTFSSGIQAKIREGKRGYRFTVQVPLVVHRNLRTFNGYKGRVYLIDANGRMIGTSPDGAKFKGFKIDTFEVEQIKIPSGDDVAKTTILLILSDTTEFDDFGASFKPADLASSWNALDLEGLQDVNITVVSSGATGAVLSLATTGDQIPVTGAVAADFVMTDDSLGAETITGCTDNADGTYTFTWSTIGTDTYWINLKAPSAMTLKGYESTGKGIFTIE
jgi:hypothetical protein